MVQLHTIEGPGSPVAVVEVPDTERACLLTMEAEPNKCWTDPYMGASETMALSLRGLWISGAEILGMTNCLNFASPEAPENSMNWNSPSKVSQTHAEALTVR